MRVTWSCFVAFLFVASLLPAEDIVLVDGRYLQIKVLDPSKEGLKVQILDTGGQVFIPFGIIAEPYRTELMIRFGYQEDPSAKVIVEDGVRITMKKDDEPYEGRIEAETPEEVTLKHRGTKLVLKREMIKEIEKVPVSVLEIYTPQEYFDQYMGTKKPADDSIQDQMDVARVAENVGLYEPAAAALLKVRAVDSGYEPELLKNKLDRLEALSKNKQFRDAITDCRKMVMFKQFPKAFQMLTDLEGMKELPDSLKAEISVVKEDAVKKRYDYYRLLVRQDYENTLRNKIRAMSRDPKLTLDDARRKLRAELHKEVVADVAARLGLDPKSDVEKMWTERGFNTVRTATYGSGSFIVLGKAPEAAKLEADMNKQLQDLVRQQKRGGKSNQQTSSLSAQPEKLPKPPTKEEWWTKVSDSGMREQWMLAFWAENSKKVEVVGDRNDDCSRCGGAGSLKFSGSQGEDMKVVCPSCQGHKHYKGVAFK